MSEFEQWPDGQNPTLLLLGRIEGKLDGIYRHLEETGERHREVEKRLNAVERKIWYGTGLAAAIGFVVAQFKGLFH